MTSCSPARCRNFSENLGRWVGSGVAIALAKPGELACGVPERASAERTIVRAGGKPGIALEEIKFVEFRKEVLHEAQDLIRLELIFRGTLRFPVAHGELGDPDGLVVKLLDHIQPLQEGFGVRRAVGMDAD